MTKGAVVGRNAKLQPGIINRIFKSDVTGFYAKPTQEELKNALMALDDAANLVERNASEVVAWGNSKVYFLASDSAKSTTGLVLRKYKDQKQTIFPRSKKQWDTQVLRIKVGERP